MNLRPPGYETRVARSDNAVFGLFRRSQVIPDQLRSAQVGKNLGKVLRSVVSIGDDLTDECCSGRRHESAVYAVIKRRTVA